MPQLSNVSEKSFEREKEAEFLGIKNKFILSKLNSKDFAEALIVRKISELMHAWFTLKGEVKNIRRIPVNQLKLFDVQWVLCRCFYSKCGQFAYIIMPPRFG